MSDAPDHTWRSSVRERASETLPIGSARRRIARLALETYRQSRTAAGELTGFWDRMRVSFESDFSYQDWLRTTEVIDRDELEVLREVAARPCSVGVTALVLPGPGDAAATLASLRRQVRPADAIADHSGAGGDGWSQAADALRSAPEDQLVVLLRAGDRLEADAVLRIVDRADADPRAQLVTWDDDVWGADGPAAPLFHPPTFSPDVLLSAFPHGRSIAVRAAAVRDTPLRVELGEDALWDLVLRLAPREDQVVHVPRVLCHLVSRPAPVGPFGEQVVGEHLERLGLEATPRRRHGAIQLRWHPTRRPKVSILVPTRHNEPLMGQLIDSLRSTDHPDWELLIVDNGGRNDEHEAFYAERAAGIDHQVIWWDEPFNYGQVNNAAARLATGEVLVLLNDDTVIRSPEWLDELVGWLSVPGVGTVGVQMIDPHGSIQHGGAIIGAAGMADHRFQGMAPHSQTIIGSTDWYRDSSANTAACVAIRAELWRDIGGLDERFELCGSDVVLGLDARRRGLRNVCTPAIHVDHLESATRLTNVPVCDIFASYWRYARFLKAGDPYHNPNVSLMSRVPALRAPDERSALERVGPALGRSFGGAFVQSASTAEAWAFGDTCRADEALVQRIDALHRSTEQGIDLDTVNWFVPMFDNPFYGGLATIFRIANHLRAHHGVANRFVVWGEPNEDWFRSGIGAVFPGLDESEIVFCAGLDPASVAELPAADVAIATQWQTAYQVAHFPHAARKFYLVQDFEPMFNPAGTLYALAEETYKVGLLALCNTPHLLDVVQDRYGTRGSAFVPAVDPSVFHANGRRQRSPDEPLNVFVYARPGHWRNCWELLEPALKAVKARFGQRVRIVTAGAWAAPDALADGLDHLGLLDYAETGELYRTCDIGVSLTVSEHPSYLPLELMACGVPVVAFDLPAGYWILHHERNSLLARRTIDGLVEQISRMVADEDVRQRLAQGALETVAASHASWEQNLSGVHDVLSGPLSGLGHT